MLSTITQVSSVIEPSVFAGLCYLEDCPSPKCGSGRELGSYGGVFAQYVIPRCPLTAPAARREGPKS